MKPDRTHLPSNAGDDLRERSVWTSSIGPEQMEGGLSFHADIFENGVRVCRILISGDFETEAAAEAAVTERLSRWIAEYEQRCNEKPVQADDLQ